MEYKRKIVFLFTLMFSNYVFAVDPDSISLYKDVSSANFLFSLMIALAAASMGGTARTSLLLKSNSFKKDGKSIYFFIADQIGAFVAGIIAFAFAEHNEYSTFVEIIIIILAGYMGSILLDILQNGFIEWIKNKFGTNKE